VLNLKNIVFDEVSESVNGEVFVIHMVALDNVSVVLRTFSTHDVSLDKVVHHLEDPGDVFPR